MIDRVTIRLPGDGDAVGLIRDALAIVGREAPEAKHRIERMDLRLALEPDEALSARRLADAILNELGAKR